MASTKGNILVIDDEIEICEGLGTLLEGEGFNVRAAGDAQSGMELLSEQPFDLLLLDVNLPGRNGLELLQELRRRDPYLPIIVITAYGAIDMARAAFKAGAQDYLTKPWNNEDLIAQVHQALEKRRLIEENIQLKRALKQRYSFANIVGKSEGMLKVLDLIEQIAPTRSTVLIQGESGTGKELIAKAIHAASPRAQKNFVPVNTGSMPSDLLESILFGHVKGAFTSAVASKKGLFEVADQGTIFFDEIGTVGLETQAKLLRVMQEREFMRLGGTETIKVDVRILAATNVDLRSQVEQGRFRDDLFYRFNVIALALPPLRDRREDIPLLVEHFIEKYCKENERPPRHFTTEAMRSLASYPWPGNVRELENVVERGVVLSQTEEMGPELLPSELSDASLRYTALASGGDNVSLFALTDDYERRLILEALERSNFSQTEAAQRLRVPLSTLNQKIKRLGIEVRRPLARVNRNSHD
ncbi:MAG: sigma-54-dependent Fis family transcriptional regulator [Acidobacteria bacterium]|nr:sigma-54-dependent Fis family transcriptional regulator [Acidobacteriota bacterium]